MTLTRRADAGGSERLDVALVARGLCRSRRTATEAIRGGRVRVNGTPADKPAARVTGADALAVEEAAAERYVSRGAAKLAGALDDLRLPVDGLRCVDAGASTGGFTQVLLSRGASHVTAIDVGTDQLVDALRSDPRVRSLEGTHLGRDDLSDIEPVALVVADLSFISLVHVLRPLAGLLTDGGVLLPMVKPQFEVGRGRLGKGGVVTDPALRREAVQTVCDAAADLGFALVDLCRSRLPGPAGNVEYFVRLESGTAAVDFERLWARRAAERVTD